MELGLVIKKRLCKGCGICVELCPKRVLELDEVGKVYEKEGGACIQCGQCELRCPDYAIEVIREKKEAAR